MADAPRHALSLTFHPSVTFDRAGLFISRGEGIHGQRRIDTWELILVRTGTLHMHEDHRPLTIGTHEVLLLRPGRLHGGTRPYERDLSFFWLHFHVHRPARATPAGHRLTLPQHRRPARPDRLIVLFRQLLDDMTNQTLTPLTGQALLTLILHEAAYVPQADTPPPHRLAAQAESLIAQHAHRPISTSTLAAELQCSPDYLGDLFKRSFGRTITQAILHRKIKDACQWLRDSRMNVNQVALACGFQTPGYFRRQFFRQEGMTPSRYRRLHQRLNINVR